LAAFWAETTPKVRETNDSFEYLLTARNLYEKGVSYSGNDWRRNDPAKYSRRPPGYPLILAAVRVFSDGLFWIGVLQIGMTFAVALLLWRILYRLGLDSGYRLAIVAVYLFYPPQIIYSQLVMAEVTFQLVMFSTLYFLLRFLESREWKYLLLLNLMLALAPLVKPMALYLWIPNAGYHLWLGWRLEKKRIVAFSLIPLAVISLWSYRNYLRTDYFHFSSIKTAAMRHLTRYDSESAAGSGSFAEQSRGLEGAYFREKLSNWPRTIRGHLIGAIGFYLDPGRFDVYQFFGFQKEAGLSRIAYGREAMSDGLARFPPAVLLYLGFMFLLNLCIAVAFCGFLLRGFSPIELKLFVFAVVLYFTIVVGPMGYSRYRLGVEPFLLLGAVLWVGRYGKLEGSGSAVQSGSEPGTQLSLGR
jgi:hypothetical protein